jgi:hypothetical protein
MSKIKYEYECRGKQHFKQLPGTSKGRKGRSKEGWTTEDTKSRELSNLGGSRQPKAKKKRS